MNKKGISPIIAVTILVIIVIGIGVLTYLFFSKTESAAQEESEKQTERAFQEMHTKIKIEYVTKDKLYIRNIGLYNII